MQERLDGWGGNSRPMVVLIDNCGCKWTRDGSARLSVCTPCLTAAIRRDQAGAAPAQQTAPEPPL